MAKHRDAPWWISGWVVLVLFLMMVFFGTTFTLGMWH